MGDTVSQLYDEFPGHYHLLFESWEASMTRQAAVISSILERECGPAAGVTILDCACGIGTPSLGLAKLGFCVTAHQLPEEGFSRKLRTLRISQAKRASNVCGRKESHTTLIGPNHFLENGSSNWTNERLTS
jgi:hypothetical protein